MYNLAPRFSKRSGSTPDFVCPNTYIICDAREFIENRAPFLSTSERKISFGKPRYTHAIYDGERGDRRIPGGASLKYTAPRLRHTTDDLPGPGEYDPKKPCCKYKPPPKHGKGRLYVCRVPYSCFISGPSIPSEFDKNGYDVDADDHLTKIPLDQHDTSLGPAFYRVPRGEICFTTRRYHHFCEWSKSNTKRFPSKSSIGPAPNAYDPKLKVCSTNKQTEYYRQMARLYSYLPRYTEDMMDKVAREGLPAPGQYRLKSCFDIPKCCSVVPRPFVSAAKRFVSKCGDGPAPGDYNPESQKDIRCFKSGPFGCHGERFNRKIVDDIPAPGAYNLKGSFDEKECCKPHRHSVVDAPFLNTAERKMGFISENDLPGPGQYEVARGPCETKDVDTCCFRSKMLRFKHNKGSDDAGPATYNTSESYRRNTSKTSHHIGDESFLTTQERLPSCKFPTPGPSDYLGQGQLGLKGLSIPRDVRFKYKLDGPPGPGEYDIHPSTACSIYRALDTKNLRLKESVLRKKLRLPPSATWEAWVTNLRKRKKLKWFADNQSETSEVNTDMCEHVA